jgi:hypothetical protein
MMTARDGAQLCFLGELDHTPLNAWPPRMPVISGQLDVCD